MATDNGDAIRFAIKRHYLYLALGIVVGFGAGYATAMALAAREPAQPRAAAAPPAFEDLTVVQVSTAGRPHKGPPTAPVTLVEFTDYQCPFCAQYFRQTYRPLLAAYEGQVRYVVRNFPLRSIHPLAQKAAEAAECAYLQDRFWEYHDLLFEHTPRLEVASLASYASQIGLDTDRFEECLESGETAQLVEQDFTDGLAYGVRSTPTFFVNGRAVVGALTLDQFKVYLDAALREARAAGNGS